MKKIKFRNIGPVSEKWLHDVGIFTLKDLEKIGAEKTYGMIKDAGNNPTKNLLYTLFGAIYDEDWRIADTMKKKKIQLYSKCSNSLLSSISL